ncbi:MAG: cell division protein SepF [Clostridiales bacterium]|jgi:FtsZ-interacting cell division protein YlmF|nr:cell division protein SepF [Clostridiales bacterium]
MGIIRRFIDFYHAENCAEEGRVVGTYSSAAADNPPPSRVARSSPHGTHVARPPLPTEIYGANAAFGATSAPKKRDSYRRYGETLSPARVDFNAAAPELANGVRFGRGLSFDGEVKRGKGAEYGNLSNINVYYPRSLDDIIRLIDSVKRMEAVIVELHYLPDGTTQKMLDFMSGAIYALNGGMQRITGSAFLFTPSFVKVTNDAVGKNKNDV